MKSIEFPSGLAIQEPLARLVGFCGQEYEYYDGVPSGDPNRVEPIDVLATVGLNSRLDTALKVRTAHRSMSVTVDPLLKKIPVGIKLHTSSSLETLHEVIAAAMTSKFVLLSAATKVLHRKRPSWIPIMDGVVVGHYVTDDPQEKLLHKRSWTSRPAASEIGRLTIARLRDDLLARFTELDQLKKALEVEGFSLSHVRITDILVWTECEPSGTYRVR